MRPYAPLCALMLIFHFSWNLNGQENKVVNNQLSCNGGYNLKEIHSNPVLLEQYNKIEKQVREYLKLYGSPSPNQRLIDPNGIITIPIVVHIIHSPGQSIGTGSNISDAQVQSQIDVINEDFSRTNPDAGQTPSNFVGVASNTMIQFRLACRDPNNNVTNGITRTSSSVTNFPIFNNAKFTSSGGKDAWPTNRYLNVWVANSFGSFNGAAQSILEFSSSPNTDGIVVRADCFGRDFTNLQPQFNRGRTLTHEIGHWLNLIHTWGPNNGTPGVVQNCNDTDECNDTPNQLGPNFGAPPANTASCSNSGDMFMNYMDITNDEVKNVFTDNQRARMRAMFMLGGLRASFIDNYFKLVAGPRNCTFGFVVAITPFCEAENAIQWNVSGPGTFTPGSPPIAGAFNIPNPNSNGELILIASWNNFTDNISVPVGYGSEGSLYSYSGNSFPNTPIYSGGYYPAKSGSFGKVSFTGATSAAQNWRVLSQTGSAYLYGSGNNFNVSAYPPSSSITVKADINTVCGLRTVQYTFYYSPYGYGGGGYYRLSPNPTGNSLTIQASNLNPDPNARTSDIPEYDVQIYNRFGQLMKKVKCPKGTTQIELDVSGLLPNQLYTARMISGTDVQNISFFKE
jgi:Pregnancy-associated plasma protein-A